ncbi:NAD+ synthase [Phenylobacterium sp. LH3H17]|uniref:NAD+ synthase n=1 Tax=Phenylobacterium sp. LH3H17 TaxID=2903901 RepID=UPI0020C97525|nr:NAD+ synthase [Phenylobacterium sp. LH3H17]UTP38108.1 NAD+ synthase [Phenylobacterium sp. LH3H17]
MSKRLVIAAIQANPTVGAIVHNEALARERLAQARAAGADIALFSELFLNGYPPEDLALKPAFWAAGQAAVERLALETRDGPAALIGVIWPGKDAASRPRNALAFLAEGEIKGLAFKCDLPNYGVFDEKRVFEPGDRPEVFEWKGVKIGAPVCEDIWKPGVCGDLKARGAEILLVPNGSPYRRTADDERMKVARARVAETGLPLVYVNEVGGQDELVFDGGSFALSAKGEVVMRLPMFEEALALSTWEKGEAGWTCVEAPMSDWVTGPEEIYRAMVMGLRDYVRKSGFPGVLLGLSGGVDSAISAIVAADALGPENVRCFMLPSKYTSQESLDDAEQCARRIGCRLDEISIAPAVDAFAQMLTPHFENRAPDLTEENIQARARGLSLMALSNKLGLMLLTTGNKSEMAVGYATLYGDMCGGYNVLKDLYKTDVYAVCAWRNANDPYGVAVDPIPERILTKAPSAELRPDQKDQDSLPEYAELDAILHGLVEEEATLDEIVARGYAPATVERIQRLLYNSEYKRRQAAPGVKLGARAFGRDRRYPIVNGFRDQVTKV